jgi:hypothetical protein
MGELPLELVECPDRRLSRAATEMAAELAADGKTEVMLVLPRRLYRGVANRLLHSHAADRIVTAVSTLPHVSATIAPFDVTGLVKRRSAMLAEERSPSKKKPAVEPVRRSQLDKRLIEVAGATRLCDLTYRERTVVAGRVRSVRVQPWSGAVALECTIVDDTGALNLVFLGRRSLPGIEPGAQLRAEGMIGRHKGCLAVINPMYELLGTSQETEPAG